MWYRAIGIPKNVKARDGVSWNIFETKKIVRSESPGRRFESVPVRFDKSFDCTKN